MNEIRQVIDDRVVDEQPAADPIVATNSPVNGFSNGEVDKMAVGQLLGLETHSEQAKYSDQLDEIVAWAKQEGYKDTQELRWIVRSLQDRLGSPPITEKWVTRVSRYAHLSMETQKLEAEKQELMR